MTCPIGDAFEFCIIQIPTSFPALPRRGVVGHNIDTVYLLTKYAIIVADSGGYKILVHM